MANDTPKTRKRTEFQLISKARDYYAQNPTCTIAQAAEHAGIESHILYAMRHDGRWEECEFENYRKMYQELVAGRDIQKRYRASIAGRIRRNERTSEKLEQAMDDQDPSWNKNAVDAICKLTRAQAENNRDFNLLFEKPTKREHVSGETELPKDPDKLREYAKALLERASQKIDDAGS